MAGIPSIRSAVAALIAAVVVATVWVSMTLSFDLIFHFHPVLFGVATGWSLRRTGVGSPGAPSIGLMVLLSALGAIAGTAIIKSAGGRVDPDGFTAVVTTLGIAGGIYLLHRPVTQRTVDPR